MTQFRLSYNATECMESITNHVSLTAFLSRLYFCTDSPAHYQQSCVKRSHAVCTDSPAHYQQACVKRSRAVCTDSPAHYQQSCVKRSRAVCTDSPAHYQQSCVKRSRAGIAFPVVQKWVFSLQGGNNTLLQ